MGGCSIKFGQNTDKKPKRKKSATEKTELYNMVGILFVSSFLYPLGVFSGNIQ